MEQDTTTGSPAYSALFVIGDSLSDNGAVSTLTNGAIPPSEIVGIDLDGDPVDFAARDIFYNQRFTNGDVYADVAARLLNILGDTSTFYDDQSGSNVAIGGATATDLSAFGGTASSTFANQVATLQAALAALPGTEAEKAAFLDASAASVFIGLNDLSALAGVSTAGGTIDQEINAAGVATIVEEYTRQAEILAATGIGTVILNKLPGGSFFPSSNPLIDAFGPGTPAILDGVSAQINAGIDALAESLRAEGTTVEVVDFFNLAMEIQADQETFGFLTLENALASGSASNTLLIDDIPIDQVGFIDTVHFTAELHEVFGAFQAGTLGTTQIEGTDAGGITEGTTGDDTIFAKGGRDRIRADDGDDLIFAGADNDVVFAGAGHDTAFGGTGNDVLFGETGDDILSGGSGRDILLGASDDDVIAGNAGNDFVNGGTGNDLLIDGLGSDVVFGASGDDLAIYFAPGTIGGTDGGDRDVFFGGTGNDTLLLVAETEIADVDAFLLAQNLQVFSFETVLALTTDTFESYDFGDYAAQAAMADLYGLI